MSYYILASVCNFDMLFMIIIYPLAHGHRNVMCSLNRSICFILNHLNIGFILRYSGKLVAVQSGWYKLQSAISYSKASP